MKIRYLAIIACAAALIGIILYGGNDNTQAKGSKSDAKITAKDLEYMCFFRSGSNKEKQEKCMERNQSKIGDPLRPAMKKQVRMGKAGKTLKDIKGKKKKTKRKHKGNAKKHKKAPDNT